jgi:NAD(P)-dependent dehydrogenase (short-subunit alcohol dehydrogenase family)
LTLVFWPWRLKLPREILKRQAGSLSYGKDAGMRTIKGKIAVVTGAGSGLGRAIALRLAGEGAHVHLVDINPAAAETTAGEVRRRGVQAAVTQCDLADPAAIESLVAEVIQRWGHIDILVNNAGVGWYGPTVNMEPEEWDRLLAINLHAPIRLTTKLLPVLLARPESHVVNTASIAGWVCGGRQAAYQVSKYGLIGFSESLRAECSRLGLGVTAVCPGPVLTNLYRDCPSGYKDRSTPSPPGWICTTDERVAAQAVRAIYRNQAVTVVGWSALVLYYAKRLIPWLFYAIHDVGRSKNVRRKLKAERIGASSLPAPEKLAPLAAKRAA